jgi:hypothetical protein
MKTMTWLKFKFTVGAGLAVLLAGLVTTVAISPTGVAVKPTAQEIAQKSRDAYSALASYNDSGTVLYRIGGQDIATTFNIRLQRPNLYRIDWSQGSGLTGVAWSGGNGDYLRIDAGTPANVAALAQIAATGQKANTSTQKMPSLSMALAQSGPLSGSAASTIPEAFFKQDCGDIFVAPAASGRYPLRRLKDAKVGDVDCYVVSSELDMSKVPKNGKPGTAITTLWIGKQDFLIHQCGTKYVEKVDDNALSNKQAIDAAIRKSLELQNKPVTPEAIEAMRPQMELIMKQVKSTLKTAFTAGVVFTQTHENIAVNQKFTPSDFTP